MYVYVSVRAGDTHTNTDSYKRYIILPKLP